MSPPSAADKSPTLISKLFTWNSVKCSRKIKNRITQTKEQCIGALFKSPEKYGAVFFNATYHIFPVYNWHQVQSGFQFVELHSYLLKRNHFPVWKIQIHPKGKQTRLVSGRILLNRYHDNNEWHLQPPYSHVCPQNYALSCVILTQVQLPPGVLFFLCKRTETSLLSHSSIQCSVSFFVAINWALSCRTRRQMCHKTVHWKKTRHFLDTEENHTYFFPMQL